MNPQLLGQKLLPREAAAGTKVQYMPLNGRLFFPSLGPERNFHFNASWPQSLGVLSPSKNLMLIIDLYISEARGSNCHREYDDPATTHQALNTTVVFAHWYYYAGFSRCLCSIQCDQSTFWLLPKNSI